MVFLNKYKSLVRYKVILLVIINMFNGSTSMDHCKNKSLSNNCPLDPLNKTKSILILDDPLKKEIFTSNDPINNTEIIETGDTTSKSNLFNEKIYDPITIEFQPELYNNTTNNPKPNNKFIMGSKSLTNEDFIPFSMNIVSPVESSQSQLFDGNIKPSKTDILSLDKTYRVFKTPNSLPNNFNRSMEKIYNQDDYLLQPSKELTSNMNFKKSSKNNSIQQSLDIPMNNEDASFNNKLTIDKGRINTFHSQLKRPWREEEYKREEDIDGIELKNLKRKKNISELSLLQSNQNIIDQSLDNIQVNFNDFDDQLNCQWNNIMKQFSPEQRNLVMDYNDQLSAYEDSFFLNPRTTKISGDGLDNPFIHRNNIGIAGTKNTNTNDQLLPKKDNDGFKIPMAKPARKNINADQLLTKKDNEGFKIPDPKIVNKKKPFNHQLLINQSLTIHDGPAKNTRSNKYKNSINSTKNIDSNGSYNFIMGQNKSLPLKDQNSIIEKSDKNQSTLSKPIDNHELYPDQWLNKTNYSGINKSLLVKGKVPENQGGIGEESFMFIDTRSNEKKHQDYVESLKDKTNYSGMDKSLLVKGKIPENQGGIGEESLFIDTRSNEKKHQHLNNTHDTNQPSLSSVANEPNPIEDGAHRTIKIDEFKKSLSNDKKKEIANGTIYMDTKRSEKKPLMNLGGINQWTESQCIISNTSGNFIDISPSMNNYDMEDLSMIFIDNLYRPVSVNQEESIETLNPLMYKKKQEITYLNELLEKSMTNCHELITPSSLETLCSFTNNLLCYNDEDDEKPSLLWTYDSVYDYRQNFLNFSKQYNESCLAVALSYPSESLNFIIIKSIGENFAQNQIDTIVINALEFFQSYVLKIGGIIDVSTDNPQDNRSHILDFNGIMEDILHKKWDKIKLNHVLILMIKHHKKLMNILIEFIDNQLLIQLDCPVFSYNHINNKNKVCGFIAVHVLTAVFSNNLYQYKNPAFINHIMAIRSTKFFQFHNFLSKILYNICNLVMDNSLIKDYKSNLNLEEQMCLLALNNSIIIGYLWTVIGYFQTIQIYPSYINQLRLPCHQYIEILSNFMVYEFYDFIVNYKKQPLILFDNYKYKSVIQSIKINKDKIQFNNTVSKLIKKYNKLYDVLWKKACKFYKICGQLFFPIYPQPSLWDFHDENHSDLNYIHKFLMMHIYQVDTIFPYIKETFPYYTYILNLRNQMKILLRCFSTNKKFFNDQNQKDLTILYEKNKYFMKKKKINHKILLNKFFTNG